MKLVRAFSLAMMLAPLLLSRMPSPSSGHAEVALLLVLVVIGIDVAAPASGRALGWRSVALAAFFALLLIPPSRSSILGDVPPWSAGIVAVAYVAFYFVPAKSPIPWAGAAQHTFSATTILRWAPPVAVWIAIVLVPIAYARFLPQSVIAAIEFSDIFGILAGSLWLAAAALSLAAFLQILRRQAPLPAVAATPTPGSQEATS